MNKKHLWYCEYVTIFSSSSGSERYTLDPYRTCKEYFAIEGDSISDLDNTIETKLGIQEHIKESIEISYLGEVYIY